MKKLLIIACVLFIFSCNKQADSNSKELELLQKENEILKKEKELKEKEALIKESQKQEEEKRNYPYDYKEFTYSGKIKRKTITDFPALLIGKKFNYKAALGKNTWIFDSESEIEEIVGGEVYKEGGKAFFPVNVIASSYTKRDKKFRFNLLFVFIDSRDGYILDEIRNIESSRMN